MVLWFCGTEALVLRQSKVDDCGCFMCYNGARSYAIGGSMDTENAWMKW